jgi:predicted flap endonuclease-1-like 5' DNA nuclease
MVKKQSLRTPVGASIMAWEAIKLANVKDIEGISVAFAEKLETAGVVTEDDLLEKGGSRSGRESLAEATGLSVHRILEWVNRADLARVKGIGSEYADLLEASGVDSVAELAHRNAANLVAKLTEINEAKKLVRALPSESRVADWIEQSKSLPKAVTH